MNQPLLSRSELVKLGDGPSSDGVDGCLNAHAFAHVEHVHTDHLLLAFADRLRIGRAELVLIEGSGFPAGSELEIDSESEGERHGEKKKADADGRYVSAILPYKQGVSRGTVKVTLKSADCSPSVSIPWGRRK